MDLNASEMRRAVRQYLNDGAELVQVDFHTSEGIKTLYQIDNSMYFLSEDTLQLHSLTYVDSYLGGKILPGTMIWEKSHIVRIEKTYSLEQIEEWHTAILCKPVPAPAGTRFYIDNKLIAQDVPFMKDRRLRNKILRARKEGKMPKFFELKILDSGNKETSFQFPRS